jgi:hypothetical protein
VEPATEVQKRAARKAKFFLETLQGRGIQLPCRGMCQQHEQIVLARPSEEVLADSSLHLLGVDLPLLFRVACVGGKDGVEADDSGLHSVRSHCGGEVSGK